MKVIELSFAVMEKMLLAKNFKSKQELMDYCLKTTEIAKNNPQYPEELKLAYFEAIKKLQDLSFEDIVEIKKIIEED